MSLYTIRYTSAVPQLAAMLLVMLLTVSGAAQQLDAADQPPGWQQEISAAVEQAVAQKRMPGCVVCIGNAKGVVYQQAFGLKQIKPSPKAMTVDTVFDLASLTKPIATATSVMLLVQQGKIKLSEPVATYLPAFAANGKHRVTIRQLLLHTSGLIADNSLKDYEDGAAAAMKHIMALKLRAPAGQRFDYSDMGFIVLAEVVQQVSGKSVAEFAHANIFAPLGMKETMYLPHAALRTRAAPTQQRPPGGSWMQGEVHDPRAFKLHGVAGHAGLFSTAADLSVYARMMLFKGKLGDVTVLKPATWREMTRGQPVPHRSGKTWQRGLGWDVLSGYSSNRGAGMSDTAFGHGGFTGTGIWIDPQSDLFVIFLSNRVHPDGKGSVNLLIGAIGSIAVKELAAKQPAVKQPAVKQPAVKQPAVKQPAVKQPAVKQPAVNAPAKADTKADTKPDSAG